VEEKDLDKCDHAMRSLKNAMDWDEKVYGREYDLDIFMIVAVDDFNMGAMENKGLNIFNTSCVLANSKTQTDLAFRRVESVVAHEYFHNSSRNRVTCRDWFQLSLKEGFTVFRDSEFSADMGSRAVKRVEDIVFLRTIQFAEDSGPMAHSVRPDSYM
jgi:aminopeptidase N